MGILGFLAIVVFAPRLRCRPRMASLAVGGIVLALIGIEEWSQDLVSTRTCSWADFLASAAGVIVFGIAAHLFIARSTEIRRTAI
jgi:hypothetical membrane protein